MAKKKDPSKKKHADEESSSRQDFDNAPQASASKSPPDPLLRLERIRVVDAYTSALRDADTKGLELFDMVSKQLNRSLVQSNRLYIAVFILAIVVLISGLYIVLFDPSTSPNAGTYSIIGLIAGSTILVILVYLNPLKNSQTLIENLVRLNVAYLGFIRRLNQNDLALKYTMLQDQNIEPRQIYSMVEEIQNIVDQTTEEMRLLLREIRE